MPVSELPSRRDPAGLGRNMPWRSASPRLRVINSRAEAQSAQSRERCFGADGIGLIRGLSRLPANPVLETRIARRFSTSLEANGGGCKELLSGASAARFGIILELAGDLVDIFGDLVVCVGLGVLVGHAGGFVVSDDGGAEGGFLGAAL